MPGTGSHRLFVAVDPPPATADRLAGWGRAQRGRGGALRVVRPSRIHLTLAFLGELAAADVAAVADAVAAGVGEWGLGDGAPGPIGLELGGPVLLPPRSPRVLAVEVADPDARLTALQAAIAGTLHAATGWRAKERHFRPHLTVGRIGGRHGPLGALDATPQGGFAVDEAILYRSFLEPEGARYEALERVPLA